MPAGIKKRVIPLRGSGPIKAQLEAYDGMLAMYEDAARNAITRDAMWQGGEYYRVTFVPLKFTNYARKLGYHASEKYVARKRRMFGAELPLVYTDQQTHNGLRSQVLGGSRSEARATRKDCYVLVRMPGPSYMNQQRTVYKVLRGVLPAEVERVAKVVGQALADNLEGTASTRGGAAPKRQLTPGQAATFSRSKTTAKPRKARVA
jgi:hypothetical protein